MINHVNAPDQKRSIVATKHKPKFLKAILNWLRGILHYLQLYCSQSNIHGFAYLVRDTLVFVEHIVWFILLAACLFGCVSIGMKSLHRYKTNSCVVSMERDYYYWNTTLPSLTVCPLQRLHSKRFYDYCRENHINGIEREEFYDFMENLANSSYINFDKIPDYPSVEATLERLRIRPENYMDLIYNLTVDMTYDSNDTLRVSCSDGKVAMYVRQVLTEFGLCYMANSYLGPQYSSRYYIYGEQPDVHGRDRNSLTVLQGCYFDKLQEYLMKGFLIDSAAMFVHSPYEAMKIDHNFVYVDDGMFFDIESIDLIADMDFKSSASILQRKCRYQDETNLTHFPLYTKNICMQECRLNLVLKTCKCIPHFYPNRIPQPKPVCSYKVLKSCFPSHAQYFVKLFREHNHGSHAHGVTKCHCMQNCQGVQITTNIKNMKGSKNLTRNSLTGSVQISEWPRKRYKRQVIFTFTDLLVNIGGAAGLFLGFSVLGAVEFLYYFTLRLIWHWLGYRV